MSPSLYTEGRSILVQEEINLEDIPLHARGISSWFKTIFLHQDHVNLEVTIISCAVKNWTILHTGTYNLPSKFSKSWVKNDIFFLQSTHILDSRCNKIYIFLGPEYFYRLRERQNFLIYLILPQEHHFHLKDFIIWCQNYYYSLFQIRKILCQE